MRSVALSSRCLGRGAAGWRRKLRRQPFQGSLRRGPTAAHLRHAEHGYVDVADAVELRQAGRQPLSAEQKRCDVPVAPDCLDESLAGFRAVADAAECGKRERLGPHRHAFGIGLLQDGDLRMAVRFGEIGK